MSQCQRAEDGCRLYLKMVVWLCLFTGMSKFDLSAVCTDIPSFSPPCTHTHAHTHTHTHTHTPSAHTHTPHTHRPYGCLPDTLSLFRL